MRDSHLGQTLSHDHKTKLSTIHSARLSTPHGKVAHAIGITKLMHSVSCGGVIYESKSEAARKLNIDLTTVLYRCKSVNFPDYFEIKNV